MQNVTLGFNSAKITKALNGIRDNVEDITVDAVTYYQEEVIELLKKGWVTVTGKDEIINAVQAFNDVNAIFVAKANEVMRAIEDTAEAVAKSSGAYYGRANLFIRKKDYSSQGATDNVDGTHYLIEEYLKTAKEILGQYIQNRIEKNYTEIMEAANDCGLYDKDGSLRAKVNGILNDMRTSANEAVNGVIAKIDHSLEYNINEAVQAKAIGESILNISGNINS